MNTNSTAGFCFVKAASFCFVKSNANAQRPTVNLQLSDLSKSVK
jgi:hypothetical protein